MAKPNTIIAGVDEVGRGPLAGDVVAAAVVLGADHGIVGLADSKKLSEKKREQLYEQICERSKSWSIARANVEEIDELNILHASMLAMKRAVESLSLQPHHVFVDGNRLPVWQYSAEAVVQGDSLIEEISAASIVAKVTRDREMLELDARYPGYGLAKHKGYPTKAHIAALKLMGPTIIHRKTFGPVKTLIEQQALF
ncbi:ribonuclease HII [Teredinibacter franksiae]|uniref:ribonuclease HII n=1 Tax=Teredinibacter franksiae TaxID=2761453 RepID=UPI001629E508|nr:ribonuclease HII [Teredinibacter franksiae]